VDALLDWYADVRRPLPWRFTRDPYALLVSEVMLQQTQAARVVPYWERWLARWPDPAALAAAELEDVLREWSGLGYPRRARALRECAAMVAREGWPADLTELPGVGPYTAAAVASFAWDREVAAVDVNVARVLARRAGRELRGRALADAAAAALPAGRAADFNQAMMELGATVCRAREARCEACPVAATCASAFAVPIPPRRRRGAPRFEDTERYARGRVLAAHLHGTEDGLDPERRERARASLVQDGLLQAR
jgi:A/G-specific adenine glycosylase